MFESGGQTVVASMRSLLLPTLHLQILLPVQPVLSFVPHRVFPEFAAVRFARKRFPRRHLFQNEPGHLQAAAQPE